MVTVVVDPGKVMAVISCEVCGNYSTGSPATDEEQDLEPEYEWFKPSRRLRRAAKGVERRHLDAGGLKLRKIN